MMPLPSFCLQKGSAQEWVHFDNRNIFN